MIGPKAIRRLIRFGCLAAAVMASTRTDAAEDETEILERAQKFERFVRDDAPKGEAS